MKRILSFQEINPCMRSVGRDPLVNIIGPKRINYDYEFIYCHKGEFTVQYEDRNVVAIEGQILIIEPGILHQLDYSKAIEVYWVHFDFYYHDNQADLARYIGTNKPIALSPIGHSETLTRSSIMIQPNYILPAIHCVTDYAQTRSAFIQLIDLFDEKAYGWSLRCKAILTDLILETIPYMTTPAHKGKDNHSLINAIEEYLQENAHRKISSQELSNHFHYHRDTLGRLFKKETGQTLKTYIQSIRHNKVLRLLSDSDLSLDMIAIQCGYTDRSHLISDFKSFKNMTPTTYRSQKKTT